MLGRKTRVGFTLVELLVVIGVIALLISILLPALSKARESANAVVCMSNMHQFGVGIQMFADSNKGSLPQKGPDGSSNAQSFGQDGVTPFNGVIGYDDPSIWFNALPPLVNGKSYFQMLWDDYKGVNPVPKPGMRNIFICPSAIDAASTSRADTVQNGYYLLHGVETKANPQQIFNGSGLVGKGYFPFDGSYVFNSKLISSIQPNSWDSVKMSELRSGAQVVVMVEKLNNPGEYKIPAVQRYNSQYPGAFITQSNGLPVVDGTGYVSNIGQTKADWRRFTTRHNGGGNLLFADGHVSHYSWTEAQIQPAEMINGSYSSGLSDANQPSKMVWSIVGPVN